MRYPIWLWISGLVAGICSTTWSSGAIAADQVVLQYQLFEQSVSVEELTTLAETGEISPDLEVQLNMAGQDPDNMRQTLNQQANINVRLLDQALNNPIGELLLNPLTDVIHTSSHEGSLEAMRAALVLSASDDNRVSLLEIMQNYPTPEVYVDGDRLVNAYTHLQALQEGLTSILDGLNLF